MSSIESSTSQRSPSTGEPGSRSESPASSRALLYPSPHINWPHTRVLRVLDKILQWDCVPFCVIDRERVKLDLQAGSTTFCSPILVDALLALSAIVFRHNIIDEVANHKTEKPAWDVFSATLANEAIQALHRGTWLPETMPDIQALGVLALYCACQRWSDESRNFAMDFAEAIRKHRVRNGTSTQAPTDAQRAIVSTYCGAITMNRYAKC